MSTDAPIDAPPKRREASPDPLDTDVLAMRDQAKHIAVQLQVIAAVRAAMGRIGADADQLIAQLHELADRAINAWADSTTAARSLRVYRRKSPALHQQARTWLHHLSLRLKLAGSADRATLDALRATRLPRKTWRQAHTAVAAVLRQLDRAKPAAPLEPALTDGAALLARLDAHAAALLAAESEARHTTRVRREARAALLALLRHVRLTWSAAASCTPNGLLALDLGICKASVAMRAVRRANRARRVAAAEAAEPDSEPAAPPAAPVSDPPPPDAPPDGPDAWLRIDVSRRD